MQTRPKLGKIRDAIINCIRLDDRDRWELAVGRLWLANSKLKLRGSSWKKERVSFCSEKFHRWKTYCLARSVTLRRCPSIHAFVACRNLTVWTKMINWISVYRGTREQSIRRRCNTLHFFGRTSGRNRRDGEETKNKKKKKERRKKEERIDERNGWKKGRYGRCAEPEFSFTGIVRSCASWIKIDPYSRQTVLTVAISWN